MSGSDTPLSAYTRIDTVPPCHIYTGLPANSLFSFFESAALLVAIVECKSAVQSLAPSIHNIALYKWAMPAAG